jgi:hypothetical protein
MKDARPRMVGVNMETFSWLQALFTQADHAFLLLTLILIPVTTRQQSLAQCRCEKIFFEARCTIVLGETK